MQMSPPTASALGIHLLAELHGCPAAAVDDPAAIEALLCTAARDAGATVIESRFHRFSPQGVSGVVIIAESHLTVHTWPEYGYAAVDIFTCGHRDLPGAISRRVAEGLQATEVREQTFERGLGVTSIR